MKPDTILIRGGLHRSEFDETSEALYLTSGYVYGTAEEAEAAFEGDIDRFIYSRYGNPTVRMFEERLRLLEGAEAAWATASGMAAVFYSLASILKSGDRVVAARGLFGSCFVILDELLPRWDIHTDFVDGDNLDQWEQALATPANAVFFESPSNPMQTLVDVAVVSALAHKAGAVVIVDNVFATPILQQPFELGADIVVYSTTKHIDGHGRTLGGAILGSHDYIYEQIQPWMRHTGPSMSPFNAWVLVKSMETLSLRVEKEGASALDLAGWLQDHAKVRAVWYPGLDSHPQYELASRQMHGGGTVVTFEIDGGQDKAFRLLNALEIVDISNNLGDAKSLVTHPATTTHKRIGPEERARIGISDGVIRLSVGLEDIDDLRGDLDGALAAT
jgi:O-succinylhomoserine sulfhydrylase